MKNIGIIVNTIYSKYEEILWANFVRVANELNYKIVTFIYGGHGENWHSINAQRNFIRQFISTNDLDGLILFSSAIGFMSGPEALRSFFKSFEPLPIVSVGYAYDDIPSIVVNNECGMEELVEHLIVSHGYKDFAYISGPEKNEDAIKRLELTKKVLRKHKLIFDDKKLYYGNFCYDSGVKAIHELLDNRKVSFECIICANDQMALSACSALRQRGYKVPEDVAVTGFDDIEESNVLLSRLTTVGMPYKEIAEKSLEAIISLIENGECLNLHTCLSRISIRRTCGCFPAILFQTVENAYGESILNSYEKIYGLLLIVLDNLPGKSLLPSLKEQVSSSLSYALHYSWKEKCSNPLFSFIEEFILREDLSKGFDLFLWHETFLHLFQILREKCVEEELNFVQGLVFEVEDYFSILYKSYFRQNSIEIKNIYYDINMLYMVIGNQYNQAERGEILTAVTKRLKIKYLYTVQFCEKDPQYVEILFAFEDGQYLSDLENKKILAEEFIGFCMGRDNNASQFLALPLYTKNIQLGILFMNVGIVDGSMYEVLASRTSDIMNSNKYMNELQKNVQNLEKIVEKRTQELINTNELLKEEMYRNKARAEELELRNKEIERLNAVLDVKSKTDNLTKLYNRYAFNEFLQKEVEEIKRKIKDNSKTIEIGRSNDSVNVKKTEHFCVVMIDIDHFKNINDKYGHLFGDKVLVTLGQVLSKDGVLRKSDYAVRFGGEEFVLMLDNISLKNAKMVAKRIQDIINTTEVEHENGTLVSFTVSMGISQYSPCDKVINDVLERADAALYYAKTHGRNCLYVYEEIDCCK